MEIITEKGLSDCPFCEQSLSGLDIIPQYQSMFSQEYFALKDEIATFLSALEEAHATKVMVAFENNVNTLKENRQVWSEFIGIPESIDNPDIKMPPTAEVWQACLKALKEILGAKKEAPLEKITLKPEVLNLIEQYHKAQNSVHQWSDNNIALNKKIEGFKEETSVGFDTEVLETELNKLKAIKSRYEHTALCDDYLKEVGLKKKATEKMELARGKLDEYRQDIFPKYEEAINEYLRKFNTGYQLTQVEAVNNRVGSSCNYSVLIDKIPVPLTTNKSGQPAFKNTLSSGDRNTLALAFFFASIEMDRNKKDMVVVLDDPMTSLDYFRSFATRQHIKELVKTVDQVIVLSHSKQFLFQIWESVKSWPESDKSAIKILGTSCSILSQWAVYEDCIGEQDENYAIVKSFIKDGHGDNSVKRCVGKALRLILEGYLRAVRPDVFPPGPGSSLGQFIGICKGEEGKEDEILSTTEIKELQSITEYAHPFHHYDLSKGDINAQELIGYAKRVIAFTSV